MKIFLVILVGFIIGCSAYKKPPKMTEICFDYESCNRSCYLLENKKSCRNMQYYKK